MKKILLIAAFFILLCSCEKQEIGYLDSTNAAYIPNIVTYKATLNPDDPDDAYKIEFKIPFQSPSIQKIQGTPPITYSINRIECDNGANESVLKQFYIAGKGKIEWAYNHTIPPGTYVFSINVSNEGHSEIIDSALTIVLE